MLGGMEILRSVIVVLHLIGFAMTLGPLLAAAIRKRYEFSATMNYGLIVSLVTGVFLSGPWGDYDPNYPKIGTKLVLLILLGAVLGMGSAKQRKTGGPLPAGIFFGAVGLSVAACAVAVIW